MAASPRDDAAGVRQVITEALRVARAPPREAAPVVGWVAGLCREEAGAAEEVQQGIIGALRGIKGGTVAAVAPVVG